MLWKISWTVCDWMYLKSDLRLFLSLAIFCVNFKKCICSVGERFSNRSRFVSGLISWWCFMNCSGSLLTLIRTTTLCLIGRKSSSREFCKKMTRTRSSFSPRNRNTHVCRLSRGRAQAFENLFHIGLSYTSHSSCIISSSWFCFFLVEKEITVSLWSSSSVEF